MHSCPQNWKCALGKDEKKQTNKQTHTWHLSMNPAVGHTPNGTTVQWSHYTVTTIVKLQIKKKLEIKSDTIFSYPTTKYLISI